MTVLLLIRDILTWRERQFGLIIKCVTVGWDEELGVGLKRGFWTEEFVPA